MSNIKLVCDSLSDIPKDLINKYDIEVIPLTVIFDGKEYVDGIDLTKDEFYKMLRSSDSMPKTSQCTYIQFKEVFERYLNEGKDVLYIGGSSTASGTFQSAVMAKNDLEGNIYAFDTQSVSIGSGCFVLSAAEQISIGKSIEEVINHLESIKENIKVLFTVDTLEYLQKGGRISLAKATIGNMLNIKPILTIEDGLVKQFSQVRGKKQVISKIISSIKEICGDNLSTKRIIIGYGDNDSDLVYFAKQIEEELNAQSVCIINIGSVICAHSGPGILGIA
ncbi:MAG: DegV family protein, partial [Paraclostridium sp.]